MLAIYLKKITMLIGDDGNEYAVVKGIPRFVSSDNYASAFGEQLMWHSKTQLDSYKGGLINYNAFSINVFGMLLAV